MTCVLLVLMFVCLLIVFQLFLKLHDLCTFGADVVIAVGHKCSLHCANLKHEFQKKHQIAKYC